MRALFILLITNILILPARTQSGFNYIAAEKQLKDLYEGIYASTDQSLKEKSLEFFDAFYQVIKNDSSFLYPFDSLVKIGKIYSPDMKLRIYTWNIPYGFENNIYYCFFQYLSDKHDSVKTEKMCSLDYLPDTSGISTKNWPGALYYNIIVTRYESIVYYTLLGYNAGNIVTNQKIIDVITRNLNNELIFSRKNFLYENHLIDRMVFEYGENVRMMLYYNDKLKMIVYDHLSPDRPSMEGNYQFYGPDLSFDGFKFQKGGWVHQSNIKITH